MWPILLLNSLQVTRRHAPRRAAGGSCPPSAARTRGSILIGSRSSTVGRQAGKEGGRQDKEGGQVVVVISRGGEPVVGARAEEVSMHVLLSVVWSSQPHL